MLSGMAYFNKPRRRWARLMPLVTLICFATAPLFAKTETAQKPAARASMADAWSSHKQTSKKKPPRKPKFVAKPGAKPKAKHRGAHAARGAKGVPNAHRPAKPGKQAKHRPAHKQAKNRPPHKQAKNRPPHKQGSKAKPKPKAPANVKAKAKAKANAKTK